jgi:predicted DNA-binding transcriptional regulator AlpA
MPSASIPPETGFVRLPTILQVFPVSRSAWWQGVKDGRYPGAIKLGPRTTAWDVAEIRRLLEVTKDRRQAHETATHRPAQRGEHLRSLGRVRAGLMRTALPHNYPSAIALPRKRIGIEPTTPRENAP